MDQEASRPPVRQVMPDRPFRTRQWYDFAQEFRHFLPGLDYGTLEAGAILFE